jgi:hypothetical protein
MAGYGLKPVRMVTGAPMTNALDTYMINATVTDFALYDPVAITGGYVVAATTSLPAIGVFMGCQYYDSNNNFVSAKYLKKGTTFKTNTMATAFICADPNVVYEAQTNSASGGNVGFNYTDTMKNASFGQLNTSGSSTTNSLGESTVLIDLSTVATTATLNVKLLGLVQRPNNLINTANNVIEVMINNHLLRAGVTGAT